jgi:hypothetical protein
MFRRVNEVRDQLEMSNYFSSLDGYLTALRLINPSMESSLSSKPKERFMMGIPPPRATIEVRKKAYFSSDVSIYEV